MSDKKPLMVVLARDGRVWLQSSTNREKKVQIGEWGTRSDGCWAWIWVYKGWLNGKSESALRWEIADRVPAIAEFVSQRCEK